MVMFSNSTYILEGKIDPNFSSSKIWGLMQDSDYTLGNKVVQRRLLNCIRALKSLQREPEELEKLKRVLTMIMHQGKHPNGKDVLIREYRKKTNFCRLQDVCSSKCNRGTNERGPSQILLIQ